MEIVSLDGQLALKVSLKKPYIHIKRYEPYGEEVEKATIATITEDMYVDWEVSEYQGNTEEFMHSISEYQNSVAELMQSVRECCKYNIYTEQDILSYQKFIEQQNDFGELEPNKTYYDSRAIIDGMNKELNSSNLIFYDTNNSQIPQKSKKFPFWIEAHISKTSHISLHICFRAHTIKLLKNDIHFMLGTKNKYAILEACRVFVILDKKTIQSIFKICIDSFNIKQAFGLNNPDEYKIDIPPGGENSYCIYPKQNGAKLSIHEIYTPSIFNLYSFTMDNCNFHIPLLMIREYGIITTINQNVTFKKCSFRQGILIRKMHFDKKITFENCVFNAYANFDENIFLERVSFQESIFKCHVSFAGSNFKNKAFFSLATFEKNALFMETIFEDNAYFDNATFKDRANFQAGEFHKNARFYETVFKNMPIFIQATFDGNINFTNAELDFGFEEVRDKIEESYNDVKRKYNKEQNKENKEEPKKHKISNEFRDSFRTIKGALIKDNNMLDASSYHRVELYYKELELEYKGKEKAKHSGIRDVIDRIQLMFYRLTSDHHTDLLLILNNVIFLIAWFGIMNGVLNLLFNRDYFDFNIEKIVMALGAFIACFIFIIVMLCFIFGHFKILFIAYTRKRFYCKVRKLWKQFNLKCLYNKYKNKNGIFCVAYIVTAIILVVKPALLVPIFGQMIDTKSSIGFTFASLNIIYAIFMFLLIFSLQKTARKNTIVPN